MLEQLQQTGQAIADGSRLRILKLLEPGELCVCQVTAVLGLAPATVSKHLSVLRQAGLVAQRKVGRWVYYRRAVRPLNPYAPAMLALVAGALADDETIREDRRRLAAIPASPVDALCPEADTRPTADAVSGPAPGLAETKGRHPSVSIVIYHNPACGTSRNVLAMIRNSGEEPTVIDYLKTPPTRADLLRMLGQLDMSPRQLLRRKGTPYDALGLDDPALTDAQLIDALLAHPILMERPIVITPLGAGLCRPSERVLALLPRPQQTPFVKEDGTPVASAAPEQEARGKP